MVKLAPRLPKENERNGIENRTRDLVANYDSGDTIAVVMLVRTLEVTRNKDFETVPKIEVVHIEGVPDDQAHEIRELIVQLHDQRVGHRKQPLEFGDGEDPEAEVRAPLELEASTGIYSIRIEDEPKGKFTVVLIAPSGAEVTQRHALPRAEYGELEPDTYPLSAVTGEILTLAQALIQDYESGFVTGDVVDAELVDDEETTTEKED